MDQLHTNVMDMFRVSYFWSCFCAWMLAQGIKMFHGFRRTRRVDFGYLVSTGGMPSAHSAMAAALMTSVGLHTGFGSPIFAISLAFATIVMLDASTVRRAAGMQARLLNQIVDELLKEHRLSDKKLVELLGHTRLEVFLGMLVGIFTAMLVVAIELRLQM